MNKVCINNCSYKVCFSGFNNIVGNTNNNPADNFKSNNTNIPLETIKAYYCTNLFSSDELYELQSKIKENFIEKNYLINNVPAVLANSNYLYKFAKNVCNLLNEYYCDTPDSIHQAISQIANITDEEITDIADIAYGKNDSILKFNAIVKMQMKREFVKKLSFEI